MEGEKRADGFDLDILAFGKFQTLGELNGGRIRRRDIGAGKSKTSAVPGGVGSAKAPTPNGRNKKERGKEQGREENGSVRYRRADNQRNSGNQKWCGREDHAT